MAHPHHYAAGSSHVPPAEPQAQAFVAARTLQIIRTSLFGRNRALFNGDDPTPLYHVKYKHTKPHMIFSRATRDGRGSEPPLATVTLHTFSSRIDITLGDATTTITTSGFLETKYRFPSLAAPGLELTWQSRRQKLICLDPNGTVLARFSRATCTLRRDGRIEIAGPGAAGGTSLEELVVTGLAIAYVLDRRSSNSASTGGGGSGGGSGGGGDSGGGGGGGGGGGD